MPLTLGDFLVVHLLITAGMAVLVVGAWLFAGRVGQSPRRRFSSSIAALLYVAGFFAGGFIHWLRIPTADYESILKFAAFCCTLSTGVGHLIGWLIWRYYRREIEGDEDAR